MKNIYGFEYKSEQGRGIPQNNSHSTKEIKGKTKFANAVVKVDSELGEGQEFPDLQVNEKVNSHSIHMMLVIDYTMEKL